jgi:hypothetical protein
MAKIPLLRASNADIHHQKVAKNARPMAEQITLFLASKTAFI